MLFQFYRTVLDNIPTAVIVVDRRMRIRFANRSFLMLFGAQAEKGTFRNFVSCKEAKGR